jgi:Fe-S cluster assembly iron-binding protein IscA
MFQITKKAGDMIKKFLESQKVPGKSIRILLQTG